MKSIVFFGLLSIVAWGHPHTFIDVYPTVLEKSIKIKWVFDEMSSNMLIMDFDLNHDGKINKKESDLIEKETFSYLKEFDYYTYIYSGKDKMKNINLISFKAASNGVKLEYKFELSAPKNISKIEFYDSELYSAFVLKDDNLNTDKYKIYEIDNDYFFGYGIRRK